MRDLFEEIYITLSHNKLRTSLTGFAVAWGLFMLIALLGAGNGLMNALMGNMAEVDTNSMEVYPGYMSKPYGGLKEGTEIKFDQNDVETMRSGAFADVIDIVSPMTTASATVTYGREHVSASIRGATSELRDIDKVRLIAGRFIDPVDEQDATKVMVLGSRMATNLLGGDDDYARLLGKWVTANGLSYRVVGIFQSDEGDESAWCYAPLNLVKVFKNGDDEVESISFTFHGLKTTRQNEDFEGRIKKALAENHYADPTDKSVAYVWNRFTSNQETNKAMGYVRVTLWVLGIFTLISGIVGVSNIMLISVKERTHEFGIRKAIGARPSSVLKLIIAESVSITAIFGYIGMVCGLIACHIMDKTLASEPTDIGIIKMYIFRDPTVGIDTAIGATILLIVAGTVAGLIPAWKATRVKPIEALRDE